MNCLENKEEAGVVYEIESLLTSSNILKNNYNEF